MQYREISALTGVRGFASLWVVVMHYTWGAGRGGDGIWFQIAQYGFAGVIIFLVLSGYILTHVYHRAFAKGVSGAKYADYLAKRLARVYPLHLITLCSFGVLAFMGVPLWTGNDNAVTLFLNLWLIQAWGFVDGFSWNALSWTISVEFFVYLWLPVLIWALFRLPKWFAAVLLAGIAIFLREGIYYKILIRLGVDVSTLNFGFGHYLVQFSSVVAGGSALYRLLDGIRFPAWGNSLLTLCGLSILLYACAVPLQNWLMMCGAVVLIVGLKSDDGIGQWIFGNPLSVFLGNISYALYLTHSLLNVSIEHFDPAAPLWVRLVFAIMLATVVYYLFEMPVQRKLRAAWSRLLGKISNSKV